MRRAAEDTVSLRRLFPITLGCGSVKSGSDVGRGVPPSMEVYRLPIPKC